MRVHEPGRAAFTLLCLLAAVLMAVVGGMEYEDELRHERFYCEGVADGTHPAYNADIDCSAVGGEQ